MVFTSFLTSNQLFQTRERTEWVDDNFTYVRVATEEQLTFGDITSVVRNSVSDVATREGSNGDDSDRTTCRELYRFFVDLSQVGIERTRHRVFRRDLVHTVRHDSQSIGIRSHVGEEHKYLLVFLYSEIFGSCKRHVRNEKTLDRRIFGSIHK